jgi:thiol-disulfide isomerase/thioredoxin
VTEATTRAAAPCRRAPLLALPAAPLAALLPAAALAAAASSPSGAQRAADAGRTLLGTPAPRLVMSTIDGQRIDLGRLYGRKAVYLKFWATWCVPCREQMPHLEHTFRSEGADLAVVAINAGFNDTLADVREYRRRMALTVPIVLDDDGHLGAAFNLRVTPQHIVIGRDGRIVYVGHLADARLEEALRAARTAPLPAAAVASAAPQSAPPAVHYGVGDQLPVLTVSTLTGGTFLVGASGKPTVVAFLSPWCESYLAESRPRTASNCRSAREQLEARAADPQVRLLGVASGLWASAEDLADYRDRYHVTIALSLDESGRLFREFRVTSVPTLLLIDGRGRIVRRMVGAAAAEPQALQTLLAGAG